MNTNYVISVKEKPSGRDVLAPFIVSSLDENMIEFINDAVSKCCVVIIDQVNNLPVVPENLFTVLTNGNNDNDEKRG